MKLPVNVGLLWILAILISAAWYQRHLHNNSKSNSNSSSNSNSNINSISNGINIDYSIRRKLPKSNPNYNMMDPDFDTSLFINPSRLAPRQGGKYDAWLPDKAYAKNINEYVNRTKSKYTTVEVDEAKLRERYPDFKFIPKVDPAEVEKNQQKIDPYFNKDLNSKFVKTMTVTSYYNLLDLIYVLSKNDNFEAVLRNWDFELRNYHMIMIVEDGTNHKDYNFPDWLDYEIHTCESIRAILGINAWVVGEAMGGTGNGMAIASFGSWVSTKDYNFIIDPNSKPYNSSHTELNFLEEHLYNLVTPSNIRYFDSHLDPYRPHSQFPKGVPNYLRRGFQTAMSQGLHINDLNYDAITQQLKFSDNQYVSANSLPDRSRVVPSTSLFTMSMTNVMFNPSFIGPALLIFNPNPSRLYKGHNFSEYAGVSEIIAGWVVKRTLDWVHTGTKIGPPFIEKVASKEVEFSKLLDELKYFNGSSEWYLDAYNYFQYFDVNLNTKLDRNPVCPLGYQIEIPLICFVSEIQTFIGKKLGPKYPFFKHYYDLAFSYFQVWYARKSFFSEMVPVSVQRSKGPANENSTCAVITIVHNEKDLFPIWLRYYMRHVDPRDIYIFDHMTTDGSLDNLPEGVNKLVFDNKWVMPVLARSQLVQRYQDYFIRQGYKCVLFSDTDEIIAPDPAKYPGGLREYLQKFILNDKVKYYRVDAYELGHMSYGDGTKASQELPINWNISLLKQRKYYVKDHTYNKPLLVKVPLPYRPGFHRLWGISIKVETDMDLVMFHLRSVDYDWCMSRAALKQDLIYKMNPMELATGYASHWNRFDYDKKMGTLCQFAIACFVKGRDKVVRPYDNLGLTKMETLDPIWETVDI